MSNTPILNLPIAVGLDGSEYIPLVQGTGDTAVTKRATVSLVGASSGVSSVDVSGGSTGLTTSGGPITGSGTITLGGTLVVGSGGTGKTSTTAYAVLCGGTTSSGALQSIAGVGTSGQILTSNGAGALPTFQAAPGASLTVGSSVISGGASTRILYDNAGVLGEYTITGSGTVVVMATSPTLVTPVLGVATATSINKMAITAPATSSTLAVADGKTFTASASLTLAGTDSTTMTFPSSSTTVAGLSIANVFTAQQTVQGLTTTSPGWYAQITGDSVPRVRVGLNATDVASIGFGGGSGNRDLFLERAGAATLRQGAPDAASPVAQTTGVQNVVAGTSNTAGVDWTMTGSLGTGTGAGGKIILRTAPAGSTGSTQNALATALTLTAPAVSQQPSVVVGNQALATNATDGFLYIPSCNGTPSGTPTAFAGRVPLVINSNTNSVYFYSGGAWTQPTTSSISIGLTVSITTSQTLAFQ